MTTKELHAINVARARGYANEPDRGSLKRIGKEHVANVLAALDAEREKAARLERERDELAAQLAALREAGRVSMTCGCSGASGCPWTALHAALADAAPAVEAYTRRVQAEALERAADDVCDHEQLAEGRTLAAERSSLQRWLRARAAEIRGGR